MHMVLMILLAANGTALWPGVGLNATWNINHYLEIGPAVNVYGDWSSYVAPATGATVNSRRIFVDVDVLIKPQIPIEVPKGQLTIYLAVYGGPTAAIETDSIGGNSSTSTYLAWNVAALPGVRYYFDNGIGLFTELGMTNHDWRTGINTLQFASNVGVSYAF